jgi:peptidoglycan/xylan/chitin deacetylase (PgdA/CDA1 family)
VAIGSHLTSGRSRRISLEMKLRNSACLTLGFVSKLSGQEEIVILMYHSVDLTDDFYSVNPEQFRRQIEYLRRNYAIVSLDEMVEFVKEERDLPRKTVAITFDDGFDDFYSNVYPYFRKSELPATVFVATGYVGMKWPFSKAHQKMLSWEKIEEMSENNVEIGAHTVTHPNLLTISLTQVRSEILRSKLEIENHTNKKVDYFSYPLGRYNKPIVEVVKSLKFAAALGGGGTVRKNSKIFVLNRIQIDSSVDSVLFKARLTKAVDWTKKLEQIPRKILRRPSNDSAFS